jgi:pimeloyl-ACP methyl ester carboxylesterase
VKAIFNKEVDIPVGELMLKGDLFIPLNVKGIIIFSHGSGSSRCSVRNIKVATYLQQLDFGTLLFDLLTLNEEESRSNRFDIELLSFRLKQAVLWLEKFPPALGCNLGVFGASTGAASALKVASTSHQISALVLRGGRPDLAFDSLQKVRSPTLLIVGGLDSDVIKLNQEAFNSLNCTKKLEIIDGATHLFEEPGKLDIVSKLASDWFDTYLVKAEIKNQHVR